jgi:lipoprotein-anchoring transpeptidase ErfK/SrfK
VTAFSLAAALVSCSGGGVAGGLGAAPTKAPPPKAEIVVEPADGTGGVAVNARVVVRANAPLAEVVVGRGASASQDTPAGTLEGRLSDDGKTWTAAGGLWADSAYRVHARTRPARGVTGTAETTAAFATSTPAKSFKVSWEPVNGQTVGVGAPIALTFNAPASNRAEVQSRLVVRTNPPVVGAWHWFSDRLVHWRPQEYWKPGTTVHVEANFVGYEAAGGRLGMKNRAMDFVIGPAHVTHVDANTHRMAVFSNGVLQRDVPVSLGKPGYPTMDGRHNVLGRARTVIMDSATVGIPEGHPEYYRETVEWNVQFTSGGLYVHSAPWSVPSQGVANVSHGCVNASPENAEWFYGFSRYGDVIDIKNTGRPPDTSQLGNDWSVPWSQWVAGSALPVP